MSACGDDDDPPAVDTACQTSANGGVVVGSGVPGDPALPEPSSGYKLGLKPVTAKRYMVVTANPLASQAGCEVLKKGGSAVDAAVAVQMVLGLVEPQSSGIGGGAFMLHYDAASKAVESYDGREQAPAAATENYLRHISDTNTAYPLPTAPTVTTDGAAFGGVRASGRAVGTPGAVKLLALAHGEKGRLPWADLFQPAIKLSRDGFQISGRLADAIVANRTSLLVDPDAAAYFLGAAPARTAKPLGTKLANPDYADTLSLIATQGPDAFYKGPSPRPSSTRSRPRRAASDTPVALTPGLTETSDLGGVHRRQAHTGVRDVPHALGVGMPPPSSGGIAVLQALGILEHHDLSAHAPTSMDDEGGKPAVLGVHLVAEAERLAYADRNMYVADTDFVPLPGGSPDAMLSKDYLRDRAALISLTASMGTAAAGTFPGVARLGTSAQEGRGTTHMTIVDARGNVVVMTTTVESSMGSFRVRARLPAEQPADRLLVLAERHERPIANRVGPAKRPRSSMAPTLVFAKAADGLARRLRHGHRLAGRREHHPVRHGKTLVGVLDWNMNAQQATSMINFGASNSPTTGVGGEHPNVVAANNGAGDPLVTGLRGLGHTVSVAAQSSGTGTVVRKTVNGAPALVGGADPRREGLVLGDTFTP